MKGQSIDPQGQPASLPTTQILPDLKDESLSITAAQTAHLARALSTAQWCPKANSQQAAIDTARARAFLYRFLAKGFEEPTPRTWAWLSNPTIQTVFSSSVWHLAPQADSLLRRAARDLIDKIHPGQFEQFTADYLLNFNSSASVSRQPNLEPFLKTLGLSLAADCTRSDQIIGAALEFMSLLATKEADALERAGDTHEATRYSIAQTSFVREQLGEWLPGFLRESMPGFGKGVLAQLATFTLEFVEKEGQAEPRKTQTAPKAAAARRAESI